MWGCHASDVGGVHAEEGGDEGEREEDDGYHGEDENGAFLAVSVGLNVEEVLKLRGHQHCGAKDLFHSWRSKDQARIETDLRKQLCPELVHPTLGSFASCRQSTQDCSEECTLLVVAEALKPRFGPWSGSSGACSRKQADPEERQERTRFPAGRT